MKKHIRPLIFFGLAVLILVVAIRYWHSFSLEPLRQTLQTFGIWAPLIYIALYVFACVFFLPGSVMTIVAGLVFGWAWGTLYALIGAVIGATVSFILSRYLLQDWVRAKIGRRANALIQGVEQEGWKFVMVLRLVPLIPFNLLNYALGLTRVSLLEYVLATALFILPGTFAYAYLGSVGADALHMDMKSLISRIFIAIGLLVLVALIPWFVKKIRGTKSVAASVTALDLNDEKQGPSHVQNA